MPVEKADAAQSAGASAARHRSPPFVEREAARAVGLDVQGRERPLSSSADAPSAREDSDAKRGGDDSPNPIAKSDGASTNEAAAGERPAPESDTSPSPAKPLYKRPLLMASLGLAALVLIVIGLGYWLWARQYEWTDDAFIDGHVVQMAPKVAGYVAALHVTDNQLVDEGQLLLEIDPRDYQTALDRALAAAASAASRLHESEAQVLAAEAQAAAARADVAAAEAVTRRSQQDLARYQSLAPTGAASQQSLDTAVAGARSSTAQELANRARVASADSDVRLAEARRQTASAAVAEADAQAAQARLDLSYTKIHAPITGRVTRRTVELGDYLQPGQGLFALVDPRVWVTANFKETQLARMRPGQEVRLRVDAFSKTVLNGHVDSFQRGTGARFSILPAENATGNYVKIVQRVPVKIVFDEPLPADMILGPGMSVVPRVAVR